MHLFTQTSLPKHTLMHIMFLTPKVDKHALIHTDSSLIAVLDSAVTFLQ